MILFLPLNRNIAINVELFLYGNAVRTQGEVKINATASVFHALLFPLCTPPFFVSRECAVCGLNINLTKDLFITSCLVLIYIPILLTNGRQIIKLDVGWSQAVQMTCVLPPYCFNIVSI